MKEIWLGIKDYIRDSWHDWLVRRMKKLYEANDLTFYDDYSDIYIIEWKEGGLWYYIRQRRFAKQMRK